MRASWPTDTSQLVDAAGPGWAGLWSLLFTAERAANALSQVASFAEAMDLYWLGEQLHQPCDDVAVAHPGPVAAATAVDLGPVSETDGGEGARRAIAGLLGAAIVRGDELLAEEQLWRDVELLTASTASMFAARVHLVGSSR